MPPLQGLDLLVWINWGVASSCLILPRWGTKAGRDCDRDLAAAMPVPGGRLTLAARLWRPGPGAFYGLDGPE